METPDIADSIKNTYLSHHKEKTLAHAEKVAETALWLAEKHHLDRGKIRIASLLHDISAIMTPQEMYETVKARGLPIDPAEEKHHFLLHQRVSRIIAEERFGIHDEIILNAIECHTTLKKDAGPYDKTVFIADKISWDQEGIPPYHEMLCKSAERSLDEACFFYIHYQFEHQLLLMPHRWIMEAYEDLRKKRSDPGLPKPDEKGNEMDLSLDLMQASERNETYPRPSVEIEYSGPISVPMDRESAAIRSAPAYDKQDAKKYIPLMPEIRKLADEIRDEDGLTPFGDARPSDEALRQLEQEIRRLSADNHKVSLIMMDLRTRSGAAYHSSEPMCTQSTIKAIYVGALLESCPEALEENGQYMHDAIVYSSNEAYENLRSIYGRDPIRKWCAEAGVDPGMAGPDYPRDKSARDMFKLWSRLYCFLNEDADRTNFGAYYADSIASASAKQLPVPVQTKAGWENGVGDYVPLEQWEIPERFRDGDPLNDECAINDTGIVYGKSGPYIFVIYTNHPFAILDGEEMENPLNSLVRLLYRVYESISDL